MFRSGLLMFAARNTKYGTPRAILMFNPLQNPCFVTTTRFRILVLTKLFKVRSSTEFIRQPQLAVLGIASFG